MKLESENACIQLANGAVRKFYLKLLRGIFLCLVLIVFLVWFNTAAALFVALISNADDLPYMSH